MKHGVGTIWAFPAAAREGAMIAYGPDYIHMYRRAPFYVDRVLKGTKPADLPVELPSKVELLVNLKTAKALDREVPYMEGVIGHIANLFCINYFIPSFDLGLVVQKHVQQ
jgi:ABC-type uncharacterized transport system substrate-binding protein